MGTRQADALTLVRRAENAGWLVSRSKDGWKIQTPKGPYSVHLTYSDVRSLANAEKALERLGLKEAEASVARALETERQARMTKAQAAAFSNIEKAQDTAFQAQMAGQYQKIEKPHITWYAQPHEVPWFKWVYMTPQIAQYLLDNHNDDNRPLKDATWAHYRDVIVSGQWRMTHQGGAQDTRGMVQDGQHRLTAIVEAGKVIPDLAVPMAWFVGMPVDNFKAIDELLLRTAADLFAKDGEKNTKVLQTAIRLLNAFDQQNPRRVIRQRTTNTTVYDYLTEHPNELRTSAQFGARNGRKLLVSNGALAAAHYAICTRNGYDNKYVRTFFDGLVTGVHPGTRTVLDDLDPRTVARKHFPRQKMKQKTVRPIDAMSIIVIAWNNVVTEHSPNFIKFTDDTPIPRVKICMDTGPNASAAPSVLVGEVSEEN